MAKIYRDAEKITIEDGTGGTVELSNDGQLSIKGPTGYIVGNLNGKFTGSMKLGVFTFTQSTDKSGSISFTNGMITGTLEVGDLTG
ncbi:hypothetical protein [Iodobacter fluviatilis]|uniref:Uncharacterized protein n=1 Tax=Iodobacter fluviatilis TaxID=537 RepID=A0A377Q2S7_9NEIS|nr:hypothetical protein [Iodobacter fluviatilis]TCU90058.1 hypothetical protein EV682_10177 [Iodobacter fluviatilis]STQ89085.1 Uncharacterised protein [Iodobacter fluviatilis]